MTKRKRPIDGAQILNDVRTWLERFIAVTHKDDLDILTLWIAHTHLVTELRTSPRLMIDSIMPGSGKTTVLDHCDKLCFNPVQAASLSSPALIPRMLSAGMYTILLDEVDRTLNEKKEGVGDLLAILNSGYRVGATRPVLVKSGDTHVPVMMPTYAPVAMAGNYPKLPGDTMSRAIRILMMPDSEIEDSDWEYIEPEAVKLYDALAEWADSVRENIPDVALPDGCIGRMREKWRPLKRVAALADGRGGDLWTNKADRLIRKGIREDKAERENGLKQLPIGVVLINDLRAVWPLDPDNGMLPVPFMSSEKLVKRLMDHNPTRWGEDGGFRKLSPQRLGKMIHDATKRTSSRDGRNGPRGFKHTDFATAWSRLGVSE